MEELLGLLSTMLALIVGASPQWSARKERRPIQRAWTRVAEKWGLELVVSERAQKRTLYFIELRGSVDGVYLTAKVGAQARWQGAPGRHPVWLQAQSMDGAIPLDVSLRPRGSRRSLRRTPEAQPVEGSRKPFEASVEAVGSELLLSALLSTEARNALSEWMVRRGVGRLEYGRLLLDYSKEPFVHEELEAILSSLVEAVRLVRLSGAEVEPRLAHNARHDPDARVRLRCLEALREGGSSDLAGRTCQGALSDPDPRIRSVAVECLRRSTAAER